MALTIYSKTNIDRNYTECKTDFNILFTHSLNVLCDSDCSHRQHLSNNFVQTSGYLIMSACVLAF